MSREQRFSFAIQVSVEFLAAEPAMAQAWLDASRKQIGRAQFMRGPRGGAYRLTTAPDDWRVNIGPFWRPNMAMYVTKRKGQYVRPSRVPHPTEVGVFGTFSIPVKDGQAMLPDGSVIQTPSRYIQLPVPPPLDSGSGGGDGRI